MVGIIHQVIRWGFPLILSVGAQTLARAQLNPVQPQPVSIPVELSSSNKLTVQSHPAQLKTRPDSASVVRICTPSRHALFPLYVVDDVVVSNINSINPSEIESIEIIKTKEAILLYGKKGKNGVIKITMK